jgi:ABC-type dipeptide/oligopeptide/nickel transport system permease component
MTRVIIRRLLLIPVVLIGVYLLGYAYALLAAQVAAAENPFAAQRNAPPILETTLAQLGNLARFDFGTLPDNRGPAAAYVLHAAANSLGLLLIAFVISTALGLMFGFIAVKWNPPGVRRWVLPAATLSLSLPAFYVGILGIALALRLNAQAVPVQGFGWDAHLVLPVIALSLRPTFQLAAITADWFASQAGLQYVTTARSVGNAWPAIQRKYISRNVLAPIVLSIAASLRLLAAELIVVEWLFNWPGLGRLLAVLLAAPSSTVSDVSLFAAPEVKAPLIALSFALLAFLFMLADLIATIVAQSADPRLQQAERASRYSEMAEAA